MKQVELQAAYHWFCDNCGADNFLMGIKAEFTDEERERAYRDIHELNEWDGLPDDWQNFEMVTIPDEVTCSSCGETFSTLDERDVPPEE